MLGDDDEKIRRLAVNKIQGLRGKSLQHSIPNGNFRRGYVENCQNTEDAVSESNIRIFQVLIINFNARSFHQMVNLNGVEVNQPPAINHHRDSEIEVIRKYPLKLNYPCHNQHVERRVKLVTEVSSQVCGIDRRDGLIRQKLVSRQIMKKFHSKHHFTV